MTPKLKDLDLKDSAIDTFARLAYGQENCFLLEILQDKYQPQTTSRSYIGIAPKRIFTATDHSLFVDGQLQTSNNPYFSLRGYLPIHKSGIDGYVGGFVGYFSHEAISYIEPELKFDYPRSFPDFQFGEYQDGLIFTPDESVNYFHYGDDRSDLYLEKATKQTGLAVSFKSANHTQAAHADIVNRAKEDIINGRVFQVVLANKYSYSLDGDLLLLYKKLRQVNPSPFMFFIKFGNIITMGASPELLAHTRPNGDVYLEALAGTVRRGETTEEDEALAKQLLADPKELAEHSMLVDLARNDMGRISQPGSVHIEKLMYIKKLSHVQHVCSLVKGQITKDKDMFDTLAASFAAGTLTGAPKIEAVEMISQLEAGERGPYGGTIGYFGYNGDSMHAVNIRSVHAIGKDLYMCAGSGIVYDSVAAREYQEIGEKKAAMDRALKEYLI